MSDLPSSIDLSDSPPAPPASSGGRGIARSAGLIGLGNIASRVLGLVRESVLSALFGSSPLMAAFTVASQVPTLIYDMLIGGMLSSALVPVFSDYASRDDRNESLWRLASLVISAVAALLALVALGVFALAGPIAALMVSAEAPEIRRATSILIRFIAPSIFFFGLSGAFTGLLYALKRFQRAAFAAAVYNLGIIIGAVLLSQRFEGDARILGLALGILLGSVMQVALLLPGLRDAPLVLRLRGLWREPGVRRILALYAPITLSVVVAAAATVVDRRLASYTLRPEDTINWMRWATTLIQLPLGLVASAISLAVLPDLSRFAATGEMAGYRSTLHAGLRLVLVLIVPAAVALLVLAEPTVRLLFERGRFTPTDTLFTALALRLYLIGLIFAALDQVLIFAFYARQNTLTPALVGVLAIGVYLAVALPLLAPLQMSALVLANAAQHASHAIVMMILLQRRFGGLTGIGFLALAPKVALAALAMAITTALTARFTGALLPGLPGTLLAVAIPGAVGFATYGVAVALLRIEEARRIAALVTRKLGR